MGLLAQPAVAAVFAGVAACAFASRPRVRAAVWYPGVAAPGVAATGVAAVLTVSWWVSRRWPEAVGPSTLLMAYEAVLLAVAVAFPWATRAVVRGRATLADRLVSDARLIGVEGMITQKAQPALGQDS